MRVTYSAVPAPWVRAIVRGLVTSALASMLNASGLPALSRIGPRSAGSGISVSSCRADAALRSGAWKDWMTTSLSVAMPSTATSSTRPTRSRLLAVAGRRFGAGRRGDGDRGVDGIRARGRGGAVVIGAFRRSVPRGRRSASCSRWRSGRSRPTSWAMRCGSASLCPQRGRPSSPGAVSPWRPCSWPPGRRGGGRGRGTRRAGGGRHSHRRARPGRPGRGRAASAVSPFGSVPFGVAVGEAVGDAVADRGPDAVADAVELAVAAPFAEAGGGGGGAVAIAALGVPATVTVPSGATTSRAESCTGTMPSAAGPLRERGRRVHRHDLPAELLALLTQQRGRRRGRPAGGTSPRRRPWRATASRPARCRAAP